METYLYHHGVIGQKWGIRRYQNLDGTRIRSAKRPKNFGEEETDDTNTSEETDGKNSSGELKKNGLSKKQKIAIGVGAAVAVTLAAAGGYLLYKKYHEADIDVGKKFVESAIGSVDAKIDPSTGLKTLGNRGERTIQQLTEDANITNASGGNHNCMANAFNMALRRMGFDSVSKNTFGGRIGDLELAFDEMERPVNMKGLTGNTATDNAKITNELLKNGEGSFGVLTGRFSEPYLQYLKRKGDPTTGHALYWEVLDGKVNYVDSQNRTGDKVMGDLSKYLSAFDLDQWNSQRLDNAQISEEASDWVSKFVQSR